MTNRSRLWVVTECCPRPAQPSHCAFTHRPLAALQRIGWDVRVLRPSGWFPPLCYGVAASWRAAHHEWIPKGYTVDGVSVQSLIFQNRVPARWCRPRDGQSRIAIALTELLSRHRANADRDVVLAQFALPYGPVVSRAAKSLGLPHAIYLRGDDVWRHPHLQDGKRMASFVDAVRGSDLVLAVAKSLIDEAQHLAGASLPAAIVPNGVDLALYRPVSSDEERRQMRQSLGIAADAVVILCVGDALLRKGWLELFDAVGRIATAPRVTLLAVTGAAAPEIDLAQEAARRAPAVELRHVSNLDPDRLAEVYRAADIFALLSHWEGLANALLEAMASGLPVVTSDVPGHLEVVTDNVNGRVVPMKDAASAAMALTSLTTSADLRRKLGAAARRRVEAIGTPATAAAKLSELFYGLQRRAAAEAS